MSDEKPRDLDSGATSSEGWPAAPSSAEGQGTEGEWPAAPSSWPSSESGAGAGSVDDKGWPTPAPVPGGGGGWPAASDGAPQSQSESAIEDASSNAPSPASGDQQTPDDPQAPKTSRLVWVMAAIIVIALPIGVGVVAFIQPTPAEDAVALEASAVARPEAPAVEPDAPDPIWTRPTWANGVEGMVAFELPASDDVRLANGRLRPTLGISCANGRTDIHVATGGSAPIDPVTSGHVVTLVFDGRTEQAIQQQWVASEDQRNLLAPEPLPLALRIASSRLLELTFTHYMTGAEVLEFDLRGADEVVASMAAPCGWTTS